MRHVGWRSVWRCHGFTLKLFLLASFTSLLNAMAVQAQQQAPELLTYQELVQLYKHETTPDALKNKLRRLLTTPFVNNEAAARGVKPLLPTTAKLGRFLRVVEWNIERGLEYEAIKNAFTDAQRFAKLMDSSEYPRGAAKRKRVLQQVALMKQADVIILNEVDWGLKRTDYRNVAADLAAALGMNYGFGVEFVEVDPINLGLEKFEELPAEAGDKLTREIHVDQTKYKGLHGTAIISRFTLENVRLEPFEHQPHDWYEAELKA